MECDRNNLGASKPNEALERKRLLTEVSHLLANRMSPGEYDSDVLEDVRWNLFTATQEMAMPYAVTTTLQRVAEGVEAGGTCRRMFMWLGKCAVDVARSGYEYHFSEAAHARVAIEVEETRHNEDNLRPGFAQVFISPRMSKADAPAEVARREHLGSDDAVRVSYLQTDRRGRAVGRRLESLLVRDVPLSAWVAMLGDSNNIFGRAFSVRDGTSALSVMELFRDLELPENRLPHGPVSLLEAVVPYIADASMKESVQRQLGRFHKDQALYQAQAERTAADWLRFEVELAESLASGKATFEVQRFIYLLQHQWGDDDLACIRLHAQDDGGYAMNQDLAARLEKAKRNVLAGRAAVAVRNEHVIGQIDLQAAERIYETEKDILRLQANGASVEEIARLTADAERQVARQNIRVGGGCIGESVNTFRQDVGLDTVGEENPDGWQWKPGICRVPHCPSPKPTDVGPCSVCWHCQKKFDAGRDPVKEYETYSTAEADQSTGGLLEAIRKYLKTDEHTNRQAQKSNTVRHSGELALAAAQPVG